MIRTFGLGVIAATTLLLAGCTAAAPAPSPVGTPPGITLGAQTYALDQLHKAPDDGSGARLLYAVVRISTAGGRFAVHEDFFTLVDAAGQRYRPVQPSVYVPIDHLDGLTVSPGHTVAGVVAFPVPAAAPRMLLVDDGTAGGSLNAP